MKASRCTAGSGGGSSARCAGRQGGSTQKCPAPVLEGSPAESSARYIHRNGRTGPRTWGSTCCLGSQCTVLADHLAAMSQISFQISPAWPGTCCRVNPPAGSAASKAWKTPLTKAWWEAGPFSVVPQYPKANCPSVVESVMKTVGVLTLRAILHKPAQKSASRSEMSDPILLAPR